jgi:hypothetical protein
LNEVIDIKSKREMAFLVRVPATVFFLLLFTAGCALGLTGYSSGVGGSRDTGPTMLMALLVAAVIFVLLDLQRLRQGIIREPQRSIIALRESMDRSARHQ